VGYASIRWLLRMLTSHTLWPFVAYRLALAGVLAAIIAGGWADRPGESPDRNPAPAAALNPV